MKTTKNIFPALPFFSESKLNRIEDDLNQKIADFITSNNLKNKVFKSFINVDDYNASRRKYDTQKNELTDKLYNTRAKYMAKVEQLNHLKHDYINLIAVDNDENLDLFNKQNHFIEKVNTGRIYLENSKNYNAGIIAHQNALSDEVQLHNTQVEHLKSVHYKQTADNCGLNIDIIKSRNSDLRKDGFLNGETTLKKFNPISEQLTELPTYPSKSKIETENTINASKQEIKQPPIVINEKSLNEVNEIDNQPFSKEQKFSVSEELPDYLRGELELLQSTYLYGKNYQQVHFDNQELNEKEIDLPSSAESVIHIPKVQTNVLSRASLKNCLLLIFCIIAAMAIEYLVFRSILTSIFKFSLYKSIVSGFIIVVLSKGLSFILHGVVKDFVLKLNALRWKVYASRYFIVLFAAILFYTASVGLIYSQNNQRSFDIGNYQMLLTEKESLQNNYEVNPTTETKIELQKIDTRIADAEKEVQYENGSVKFLKAVIIILSSSIILLVNATLINVTTLFLLSYFLHRKVQSKSSIITRLEADFLSTNSRLVNLKKSFKYLTQLVGQRIFIRSLKTGATPTDAHYNPSESKSILPLE